jgi:hypothetical protein
MGVSRADDGRGDCMLRVERVVEKTKERERKKELAR